MNFEAARTQMLGQQIRAWDVLDDRVLRALRETPRELFVPESYRDLAFADAEIPLGHDQAMLAPKIEGRVLQALRAEQARAEAARLKELQNTLQERMGTSEKLKALLSDGNEMARTFSILASSRSFFLYSRNRLRSLFLQGATA